MTRNMKDLISFLNGFRKFSVMVILIVVGAVFRMYNLITGSELVTLLEATAVAFFGANVGEHLTNTVSDWVKNRSTKKED